MKVKSDPERLKLDIERLERILRQERLAYLELHRVKRRQLADLQEALREMLEAEAELYRRRELQ